MITKNRRMTTAWLCLYICVHKRNSLRLINLFPIIIYLHFNAQGIQLASLCAWCDARSAPRKPRPAQGTLLGFVHLLIFYCSKVFYAVKLSESNIGNYIFTLNLRTVAFLFFTLRSRAGRRTGRGGSYRVMRGGTPYSSVLWRTSSERSIDA